MKNKYVFRSRISAGQFRRILSLFALDLNAVQIAHLSAVSRLTIGRYVNALRRRIAVLCEADFPLAGQIEVDESYFGSRHKKGNRGRGAGNKTIVFGILKRGDRVYTEIVPNCRAATLQAIIRGRVALDSTIYSDHWRGYDGLVDVGYGKHLRVHHGKGEYARGEAHINGIEGFWGFAKNRLTQFRGMRQQTFYLHLKECEFRFNNRRENIYKILLKSCRENPLKLT